MNTIATSQGPLLNASTSCAEDTSFEHFKNAIAAAMRAGKVHYNDLSGPVSPEVQERLRVEFGNKWTFQFNNMRKGCTIFWS